MRIIPSFRWFPGNIAACAVWYQNFAKQFAIVAASLGFTAAEITAVKTDNDVYQFLADLTDEMQAFESAARQYRLIITEQPIGQPTPQFPENPNFTLPIVIPTGMFDRLNKLVDRIRAAPAYTDEIGALLGILPTALDSISPENVKPTIQTFAAANNYHFSVVVAGRAEANMFEVELRRAGQETWETVKSATGKSVDVTITPTTPGKPEQLQVRVQLQKNNADYGQPSDPAYVTVNP